MYSGILYHAGLFGLILFGTGWVSEQRIGACELERRGQLLFAVLQPCVEARESRCGHIPQNIQRIMTAISRIITAHVSGNLKPYPQPREVAYVLP